MDNWTGTVTFGSRGNYRNWAGVGWSVPEHDWTWMEGYQATLRFTAPRPRVDQMLAVKAMPVTSRLHQSMDIYLNGRFIGIVVATPSGTDQWSFLVPRSFFETEEPNLVTFTSPNAVIPAEEGHGTDQRRLSFAFVSVSLREVPLM
jgi:hypothetical protein